ncbi:MAG: phosphoribosylformylglycinamidine synthase subunit PurQ [Rickettsiales bacterium]|nr:phosphoribosylformylglycinamidine synthase subunit PurQ [Rickettsiales bacterium]
MKQVYPDGTEVLAPLTLIVQATGVARDLDKRVLPVIDPDMPSHLFHIDMSSRDKCLGGSAFAQTLGQIGDEVPSLEAKLFQTVFAAVQEMLDAGIIAAGHDISQGGLITTMLEMAFANTRGGIHMDKRFFTYHNFEFCEPLFAENPGVVIQVKDGGLSALEDIAEKYHLDDLHSNRVRHLGNTTDGRDFEIYDADQCVHVRMNIDELRECWMSPSYDMERRQNKSADLRRKNWAKQPLVIDAPAIHLRRSEPAATAAVLRDKGTNGDREMAYAAHLGGFKVRDIAMADLTSGRRDLSDVDLLLLCGGFSNSDVFGAGKVWADTLKYNARARDAIMNFYARENTLSLGVCNGCQVLMELGLLGIDAPMRRNDSGKFESAFVSATVPENDSVMLAGLSGMTLPIWVAHGEGKFDLVGASDYQTVLRYYYDEYPGNPNGSRGAVAGIASKDGRHLAMMPHPERAVLSYQWPYGAPKGMETTPWLRMFADANSWIRRAR